MSRRFQTYNLFGSTSYEFHTNDSEVSLKRYQYVGKERDGESGLYYYGARYYADWLCRFVSVDPLKDDYPYYTTYQYAGNKPVSYIDLDGLEEAEVNSEEIKNDTEPGNEIMYQGYLAEVEVTEKASWKTKLRNFGKGVLVGVAGALAVTAIVVSGGVLLAAAAPLTMAAIAASSTVATIASVGVVAGGAALTWDITQSLRGRDFWNNEISSEDAWYNLGMTLGTLGTLPLARTIGKGTSRIFNRNVKKPSQGNKPKTDEVVVIGESVPFDRSQVGTTINNATKQAEHIEGSKPYLNRIKVKKEYPSVLTEDPAFLLNDFHAGKGVVVSNNVGHKSVIIRFDKPIGNVVDPVTGDIITQGTFYGAIKYGKNTHITPVNWNP